MADLNRIRVSADFNELDEDGRLHVLTRQADRPDALHVGSAVLLTDEEGSIMDGRVLDLAEDLVVIQTIAETWRNPLAPPYVPPASGSTGVVVLGAGGVGKSHMALRVLQEVQTAGVIFLVFGDPAQHHVFEDYYDLSSAGTPAEVGAQ